MSRYALLSAEQEGAPDGGAGGGNPPAPAPVDPAAYAALVANHERLKRDAQADRDALKTIRDELEAIKADKERAETEAATKSGDVETVRKQLETKHERELKVITDRAEKAEGQVRTLVIDNGLSAALDAVKVKPELKKAAAAMLRGGVELREENGEPRAVLNSLPLEQAIKLWATDDEGKAFVLEGNSGGGAHGGGTPSIGKNPWKQGAEHSLTEQDRIQAQDPARAARLKAEAGVA